MNSDAPESSLNQMGRSAPGEAVRELLRSKGLSGSSKTIGSRDVQMFGDSGRAKHHAQQ